VQNIDSYKLAETILSTTESIFGPRVFDSFIEKMTNDHLGKEMGIHEAITQRPDLFERVFVGMFGERAGEQILAKICEQTSRELGLDDAVTIYSMKGDFAKFMAAAKGGPYVGTIMIVDDDKDILITIEELLLACGFNKVQSFNDPIKALEHFKTAYREQRRDDVLVLTDIRMQGMTGLRLAEELLRVKPDTKIILMSAYQLNDEMKNVLHLVTSEHLLQKPFEMKELCVAVRNATTRMS
jgi:CheY-like chemotaxis protein